MRTLSSTGQGPGNAELQLQFQAGVDLTRQIFRSRHSLLKCGALGVQIPVIERAEYLLLHQAVERGGIDGPPGARFERAPRADLDLVVVAVTVGVVALAVQVSPFSRSESPGAWSRCEAEKRYLRVTRIMPLPRSSRRTGRAFRKRERRAAARHPWPVAAGDASRCRWRCFPAWAPRGRTAGPRNSESGDRRA